jgi:phosphoenolpyruvate---glycerone phosphotransferase subunit DhaL
VTVPTAVQATLVIAWMDGIATAVRAESDRLTALDAAIGDGDHGINMERGFDAVGKALAGQDASVPPGRLLILSGKTLVSTVGGASGPLWGTYFRSAGRALGTAESFEPGELVAALDAGVDGVRDLGAAAPGDKTMVDALVPWVDSLRAALDAGQLLEQALQGAAAAAEDGAKATVPMQARKGRASYLGERSIGHQDPGATSAALIAAALSRAVVDSG